MADPQPGRRVLITGGASGLGLAMARLLAGRGDRVLVGDLAEAGAEPRGAAGLPEVVAYRQLDVRRQADWDGARDWCAQTWGGVDLLVNNAGIAAGGRIDVEPIDDWQRVIDINLLGVARGCHTFTPVFKRQRAGHLVNVASLAGLVHGPGTASYNATKAGVVALSETLGFELAPWGIAVSAVCPAFVRTNLHTSLQGRDEVMLRAANRLITRADRSAEQVAEVIVAGIDARRALILTDRQARALFWSKRLATPVYRIVGRGWGQRLARH